MEENNQTSIQNNTQAKWKAVSCTNLVICFSLGLKTLGQLGKIAGKNGWCQVDNFMQGLGKFNMLKSPVWKLLNEKKKTWYPTGVTSGDSQWYSRTLLTQTQTSGIEEQSFSVKLRVIAVLWRLKYIVTMWL